MDLNKLRKEIDAIDNEILKLLNKRMKIVKKVGEIKNSSNTPIYRPEREKAIIERLCGLSKRENGILQKEHIEAIFLEIFAISRTLERQERVAFLGPVGTYTHQAAEHKFGANARYLPLLNIEAVFKAVHNKEAKYGVIPIENNTEGVVGITLDSLKKYDVKIVSEICLDIHHSFASLQDDLSKIKRIYSHPQGYNQCLNFLETHGLLDIEFIPTESTAKAAKLASKDELSGAICSKIAAKLYNVPLLFEKIEDNLANRTRFIIISDFKTQKSGNDKTSVIAKTPHKTGALFDLLKKFKDRNINLLKIESRPNKDDTFNTWFYIDFEGHIDDKKVSEVIKEENMIWLGSYIKEC
ncbi:chorismate mutase/prephenate dehydratase [Lebetimonas natsushimae]|uniref:Bifunctional chorismate mutase/prephenate dehydratase n=1 Tax=Lebetimonas natsushimae TaxID=1936991 RepID=A0A292Y9E7_9BACT|nr:prephenate dehydratase [Lebetimonas natsushimae]GAX87502.1 chorismate mutase/prephenate dehydratase [Lebetimonas natsushimae]